MSCIGICTVEDTQTGAILPKNHHPSKRSLVKGKLEDYLQRPSGRLAAPVLKAPEREHVASVLSRLLAFLFLFLATLLPLFLFRFLGSFRVSVAVGRHWRKAANCEEKHNGVHVLSSQSIYKDFKALSNPPR